MANWRPTGVRDHLKVRLKLLVQESDMNELPWSNGQLRKLGKCILSGEAPSGSVPDYGEVMMHFNDVAAWTQEQIRSLEGESLLGRRSFEVASRPKTIDTLRQKLQRDTTKPLQIIQDIAGVRFEAEMTLDEQDEVVNAMVGLFGHDPVECVKDLRVGEHSGYRAVHIWLRLPTRVEVQVRTHLQSAWANMYESLADVLGRDIRYGELPTHSGPREAVLALQDLSKNTITSVEEMRNQEVSTDAQLAELLTAYDGFPDDLKEKRRESRRSSMEADAKSKARLRSLEASLQALLAKNKETFDNMRRNERG